MFPIGVFPRCTVGVGVVLHPFPFRFVHTPIACPFILGWVANGQLSSGACFAKHQPTTSAMVFSNFVQFQCKTFIAAIACPAFFVGLPINVDAVHMPAVGVSVVVVFHVFVCGSALVVVPLLFLLVLVVLARFVPVVPASCCYGVLLWVLFFVSSIIWICLCLIFKCFSAISFFYCIIIFLSLAGVWFYTHLLMTVVILLF